ncbi:MAG: outer membrane beta-barrel protein [Longimicrobiales bacterium]|nr:outer membrane beta-barrel protein [Longimicrobiales bacterium]
MIRPRHRFAGVLLLLLLGVGGATPLDAQTSDGRFEVTPRVGVHIPLADRIRSTGTGGGGSTSELVIEQEVGPVIGAGLTAWLTESWGVEGSLGYSVSNLRVTVDGAPPPGDGEADAALWSGTVGAVFRRTLGNRTSLRLMGGLMILDHADRGGSTTWEGTRGTTDLGGFLGAGVHIGLSDRTAFGIDARDYVFPAQFEGIGIGSTDRRLQNDLVLTAGLTFELGTR